MLADAFSHTSPIAPLLLSIVVIILTARLGGSLSESIGQPSVLGELFAGVLLGNLTLLGFHQLEFLRVDWAHQTTLDLQDAKHCAGVAVDALARLGVLLLLFRVGLENSVTRMSRVGLSSLFVAVLGILAPLMLGVVSAYVLLPSAGWPLHLFLGAALCATSVGITARVFEDLGQSDCTEAEIVLGAAVIDDVLALIVLSIVQGMILTLGSESSASAVMTVSLLLITAKASGFLVLAILLGPLISRQLFKVASVLHGRGLLVCSALAICFGFAWAASLAGLAPLVGAFAAGLILERVQYRELIAREHRPLHELLRPIADFVVPIFFIMMGFRVDLSSFADVRVLGLAAVLTVAAIAGKIICGWGVQQPGVNRLTVGLGMIPRGEVGLIFAGIGLSLRVKGQPLLDAATFSALVITVMLTTVAVPPLLKWSLTRHKPPSASS